MSYSSESARYSRSSRGSRGSWKSSRSSRGRSTGRFWYIDTYIKELEKDLSETNIFNLEDYFKTNVNEDPDFNLEYYKLCKTFIAEKCAIVKQEIDIEKQNALSGFKKKDIAQEPTIINIYNYNHNTPDDNTKLEDLKTLYQTTYIDSLDNNKKLYPFFNEDLLKKNNEVYKKIENDIEITDISKQNDKEFFETMQKRIFGLENCNKNRNGQYKESYKYLTEETEIESQNMTKLQGILDANMSIADKIKEQCRIIHYSWDNFENAQKIIMNDEYKLFILEKLNTFFKQPNQIEFARTFLPPEYFYHNPNPDDPSKTLIKIDGKDGIIENLLLKNDRTYRQFVFSYSSNELYQMMRSFIKPFLFEAGGMLISILRKTSCHPLVNWSIFLNLFYCRCALANSDIDFPVRFIIPSEPKNIIKSGQISASKKFYNIKIRDKSSLPKIFSKITNSDGSTKFASEFKGILSIKYYHEESNTYRAWFLYLFKNNLIEEESILRDALDRTSYITGVIEDYFILNSKLQFVNKGSINERYNVTYSEFKYFVDLQEQLYFYATKYDDFNIFISKKENLDRDAKYSDLGLQKIKITRNQDNNYFELVYTQPNMVMVGGNNSLINNLNVSISNKNDIYNDINISVCGEFYKNVLDKTIIIKNLTKSNNDILLKGFKYLSNYTIIEASVSGQQGYKQILKTSAERSTSISKYIPITNYFFRINEIFIKYNLINNINTKSNICYVGNDFSYVETLKYHNYKFNNLEIIIPEQYNYFNKILNEWKTLLKTIEAIYNIKYTIHNTVIYDLINDKYLSNKCDLLFYDGYISVNDSRLYETFYNIPQLLTGAIFSLKKLNIGGNLVIALGSIAYKGIADIYLILSEFFEYSNLYYYDINNYYKRIGATSIFKNFKGCNENDYHKILSILNDVKKIYPNGGNDYFIINKTITGFLDKVITDKDLKIYSKIKDFNNERYLKQLIYCTKLEDFITNKLYLLDIKLPTQDQILSSILYCKKYDIPYFDKYNNTKIDTIISKTILSEMYGIQEPILYNFKTPFKTYITDKIILNPKFNAIKSSKSHSSHSSITILKAVHSNISKNKKRKSSKALSSLSRRDTIGSIFRDMFSQSNNKIKSKSNKAKTIKSNYSKTRKSTLKRTNISLLNPIFPSNNQLVQVGRLIDSRRDFTKPEKKPGAKYDPQTVLYDQLKDQFRYYKGKGQSRNVPNLTNIVQERLGDRSISQAWLKMYEIITDCELVPKTPHPSQKSTFRSFHICEAPGTFINALNNYIRTKTQYTNFEWHSQSLNPKVAIINDQFRLIERHPDRWDWGADDTGDITQVANIKHYKQKVAERAERAERAEQAHTPIQLMTSDCGLEWGNPMYEFVAFSSYVAILNILPRGGTMIYKILSPIDLPLIWNLIYITFTNFKEMFFFKPIQNAQSREFYIVAKDYLGTDQQVLDKLMEIIAKWGKLENAATPYKAKWVEELDLFGDVYPVEFVAQVINISERLAQNYVNSIERIIYYMDNIDILGDEYKKHIEKYIQEKNEDWIRKYRPRKLENKWIL